MTPLHLLFAAVILAPLCLLWVTMQAHETRLKALEARKPEPSGKTGQLPVALPEKQERPKAGTVAANAIKPKVFLSQVPHQTIVLDNGGLEWESKT